MFKKEWIAMLLAGGQGSRLYTLTQTLAKPAVPFGGKYRIIDFPLSNCINSGIDTVGVLTQYQPLVLNEYIGNGQPWDLDRANGGVFVLPPYQKSSGSDWYTGTANAIYQNINFIDRYEPEYVLLLSGDHIYKMDYEKMLAYHKEKNADCTIAVLQVPMEEASRFGIMNTNPDGSIYEFEEKPAHPKSNNASMGIYIFRWSILKKFLVADEEDLKSENDFGKNVIPALLNSGHKLWAYDFEGYWKDVGTIDSLWEANMDLLGTQPNFDIRGAENEKISARNNALPSSYIAREAKTTNCFIAEGGEIYGTVRHSIISTGCTIGAGALVEDSVIMPNVSVAPGAIIRHAIIGENCVISSGAVIGGAFPDGTKRKISVLGKNQTLPENAVVAPGEVR